MSRSLGRAGFFLLAAVVALVLVSCGDSTFVEEHFAQANGYVEAGEYEKALAEFELVLEKDPENVSALSNLGVVYYNLGRLDEAIEQYQKAIEIAPKDADIYSNLAAAYVQKGQFDQALEVYQTAVDLNPELAEAHFGLGVVYRQMSMADEAISAFERFQELDTGSDPVASELADQYLQELKGQ